MLMLLLAAAVMATSAATVWLAGTHGGRQGDPDAPFWYAFTGFCALAPMILGPAPNNRALSVALLLLAAATALVVHLAVRRRRVRALAAAAHARHMAETADIGQRHGALLARWSRYELDPAAAIDFPGMSDVRVPETSALIRAVQAAARLEGSVRGLGASPTAGVVDEYRRAVGNLALALETAEQAAFAQRRL
ncbi:hypothetical protein ACFUCV_12780 [Specibacter sp. NPDC057265]|uniref:hypothetical protein n=1 Tax=Specibacter sp. NPDC057265 TaxID=3346075 RepID=UPI00362CD4E2